MKKILQFHLDYLKFPFYPSFEKDTDSGIARKIIRIIWIFIFSTVLSFLIHRVTASYPWIPTKTGSLSIYHVIIIGPILEELSYRSILVFSEFSLKLFISSWMVYIKGFIPLNLDSPFNYLTSLLVFASVYILLSIIFKRYTKIIDVLSKYHSKYKLIIYLILTLSFGLAHLTNYIDLKDVINLGVFFYILQKTVGGVYDAYIRIRYGLLYSIIVHMSFNTLPYLFIHYYF